MSDLRQETETSPALGGAGERVKRKTFENSCQRTIGGQPATAVSKVYNLGQTGTAARPAALEAGFIVQGLRS